jgi:hypothetical protein
MILNVTPGTYQLRAERIGLGAVSREVTVTAGGVLEQDFQLAPRLLAVPEDFVGGTAGAARRREVGNQTTGQIRGRVSAAATGAPLVDVQVYLLGANLGSITRQTGAYVIVNIPPGTYVLVAERVGLGRLTRQITVTPGGLVEADFAMTP